jgi:hypothetical protein
VIQSSETIATTVVLEILNKPTDSIHASITALEQVVDTLIPAVVKAAEEIIAHHGNGTEKAEAAQAVAERTRFFGSLLPVLGTRN